MSSGSSLLLASLGLATVTVAVVLSVASAQAGGRADSIVGRWTNGPWLIEVRQLGPVYLEGRLLKAAKIAGCTYPAGWKIWVAMLKLRPGQTVPGFPELPPRVYPYWGRVFWYAPGRCQKSRQPDYSSPAAWAYPVACPASVRSRAPCMSQMQRLWYGTGEFHLEFYRRVA